MPNGRSGGFCLPRNKFRQLLDECADNAVVGRTLQGSVTASELKQVLDQWKGHEVLIEEQDHAWYIVHFPEWVTVGADSPLFPDFVNARLIGSKQEGESIKDPSQFSSRTKIHEHPTYGRVLEVAFVGSEGKQRPFPGDQILQQEVASHLPQHLVVNLLEFDDRFGNALLGALVSGAAAMRKLGPGRKIRILAAGQTGAALDKVLRIFKIASLFGGTTFSDMESALAQASVQEEPDSARAASQGKVKAERHEESPEASSSVLGVLKFPDLEASDRMLFSEVAGIVVLGSLLSLLLGWIWKPLGWTRLIPLIVLTLYALFRLVMHARNWVLRWKWAHTLNKRMTAHRALSLLSREPTRYIVHSCSYGGGFDAFRLTPATCIEDTQTATLIAIFPPSSRIEAAAERLGTRVRLHH